MEEEDLGWDEQPTASYLWDRRVGSLRSRGVHHGK